MDQQEMEYWGITQDDLKVIQNGLDKSYEEWKEENSIILN